MSLGVISIENDVDKYRLHAGLSAVHLENAGKLLLCQIKMKEPYKNMTPPNKRETDDGSGALAAGAPIGRPAASARQRRAAAEKITGSPMPVAGDVRGRRFRLRTGSKDGFWWVAEDNKKWVKNKFSRYTGGRTTMPVVRPPSSVVVP